MKILKEVHRKLVRFCDDFNGGEKIAIRTWGVSVFTKTRCHSHINFLQDCLVKSVIPKGLTVKPNLNLPFNLQRRVSKATTTCSRRLMKTTITDFRMKLKRADNTLSISKEEVRHTVNFSIFKTIQRFIHELNAKLFDDLRTTKSKKLNELLPKNTTPKRTVVCIPENLELDAEELSVLSKGLKFIPTPVKQDSSVIVDLERFYRRMKLHAHFNDPNKAFLNNDSILDNTFDPFSSYEMKVPSNWTPPCPYQGVSNFIERCKTDTDRILSTSASSRHNLTHGEKVALNKLRKRDDIVVKPADKGGAVVVWKKDLYLAEAKKQLCDDNFYSKCSYDRTSENNKVIHDIINKEIEESRLPASAKNLFVEEPRTSRFYLLPKIHKVNNPGRPIVSACSCPTEIISKFLDDTLRHYVTFLPSYVKNTTHVLNLMKKVSFSPDSKPVLFTMDVKSLYTVIPHRDGLNALKYHLDENPTLFPTISILRLAELVLTLNHFEFNGEFFDQISGVSMGTRFGPTYACLFMGYLEEHFLKSFSGPKPFFYVRYIDDILGISDMTLDQLETFFDEFNDFHPRIKFTHEVSDSGVNFLDCTFKITSTGISSSVYYKPTDTHSYLDFESNHPPRCLQSIPYSQFLRLKRICSEESDFKSKCDEMENFFRLRNYPHDTVVAAREKCKNVNRQDLLVEYKPKSVTGKIPLVLTFNEKNKKIASSIHRNLNLLRNDDEVGNLFNGNVVTAYKNDKSLRETLVRARIAPDDTSGIPGSFPCGRPRCNTCDYISACTTVVGPLHTFSIKQSFTCTERGVVYCIMCQKCGELYIGETGRRLADRFTEHRRSVIKRLNTEVARHFNLPDHKLEHLSVFGLKIAKDTQRRKMNEKKLINHLGTSAPFGMNIDD